MRLVDAVTLSTRMFKTRPMRTLLTILGVSVGIGTVLFLVSFGYGLQNVILGQITTADSLLSLDVAPGVSNLVELNQKNVDEISRISGVSEVARSASLSGQILLDNIASDSLLHVVDNAFFRLDGIVPIAGDVFDAANNHDAVISSAGVKLFNLTNEEIIGKQINITLFLTKENEEGVEEIEILERPEKYTIKGVVEDENASFIYIPINTVSDVDITSFDQVKAKADSNEVLGGIRDQIIEKGFLVSSLSDTIDQVNKIFRIIQIILFSFGFVALLVSAIGMFNTMTIALLERINEIGIMRAIGITSKDVRFMFLLEAIIMGFLGGLGGVTIGYALGEFVNFGLNILASNLGGKALDLFYSPLWFVGIIIAFSTVVGFFTGVYPSVRASRLNPLDALRYK